MTTNRKFFIISILLIILSTFLYIWLHYATDQSVLHHLNKLPQNTLVYLDKNKNYTITPSQQEKLAENYIKHYFSPWNERLTNQRLESIKLEFTTYAKKFEMHPGIGANTRAYPPIWAKNLEKNMDLAHFSNTNQDAITIRDTNIRMLPSSDPSFTNFKSISKGYPFDNLQETYVPAGTPLHIIQTSNDKAWYLVVACSYAGWVLDKDIAFTSEKFKTDWQTGDYAVSKQDDIPIFDIHKRLTTKTRIGVLYPISKNNKTNFKILTPKETTAGDALTKPVAVSKQFLTNFPVPLSSFNIAEVANNLIGKPYGWGGIYGYRDCSSTTKDLMAIFGIWLPRNSASQVKSGQVISFAGMSNAAKEKLIVNKAIPFLTLIHIPGHIVLYIGQINGHPIVFQNVWGLHIYKLLGDSDRIVVGKTVITPLKFGYQFVNTSANHLPLADSMVTLIPPSSLYHY